VKEFKIGRLFHKIERNAFIGPRDRSPSTIFGRRAPIASGRHRCPVSRASSCERVAWDASSVGAARIRRRFYDLASPSSSVSFGAPGGSSSGSSQWCQSRSVRRSALVRRSRPLASRDSLLRSPSSGRARDSLPSVLRKTMSVLARSWMCRRACSERSGETSLRDDHDCTSRE